MNKTSLSLAVGSAIALGLGLSDAGANSTALLPYVVKDANRTTVVTLIGWGSPVSSGPEIHLQYWTKSTTAANTAACEPSSTTLTFTANDIVSFDTAGLLGTGPLFGDTTNLAPLGTSISYPGPRHGYLVAEWLNMEGFSAYWMEVDLANGGAHGDAGIRSFEFSGSPGNNGDNYAYGLPLFPTFFDPGVMIPLTGLLPVDLSFSGFAGFIGFFATRAVPFWPAATVSTAFTVTPLGTAMLTNDNNQVVMQVRNSNNVQGAYDRNENGIDGTVPQTVRCVGRLTPAQLMPGVVVNAAWAAQGGWGWLLNLGDGDTNYTEGFTIGGGQDLPAMVYQVDTSNAAGTGKFMSNATRIESWDFALSLEGIGGPSDIRLKRDIEPLGRLDNGLGLYRYRYNWSDQLYVGVMAQEVAQYDPAAVVRGPDGYLRVYYDRLGLKLQTWEEWVASTDFGQEAVPVRLN